MPNYRYKCLSCSKERTMTLPISSDPKKRYICGGKCGDLMTRRIGKPQFTVERETVGKWYKEQTGKELLGD
jgi:predicted nucleic acid-binding Zn ribbon protein